MRVFTLPVLLLSLLLPAIALAESPKGMRTRDMRPPCVLRMAKDIVVKGDKWYIVTERERIPVRGVRLPNVESEKGKRLLRYLRSRYRGEIVKICHPGFMPLTGKPWGLVFCEPWPVPLQEDIVYRGLAAPK